MSWLFSQALVEEFSADTYSDGEPSAQLNVMPTQHRFWRNDKTMEPSQLSRFGLTCAVLTEGRGATLLTSYLADFPARTSASQAPATDLKAQGPASGASSHGWFATFDPISSTWRTAQRSLLGDSESFSETWPRWGSMRNGVSSLRLTPVLPICESASGFWPTPNVPNGGRAMSKEMALNGGYNAQGKKRQIDLGSAVRHWPTPTASLGTKGGRITPRKSREGGTLIEAVSARTWATATARDWRSGKASPATHERNSRPLSEQVGGLLNPDWVEWLMGWPIGWTELKPLAMDKFHEWQQQHGNF